MTLLTPAELAAMRTTATEALDGTAVIMVGGTVSDGGGGFTEGWSPAGTVPCRLAPYTTGATEVVEGDRGAPGSEMVFTLPALTEIDDTSRIVCDGREFAVTAVRRRTQEITRRVQAKGLT